jgi:hypothetical protein
MHYDNLRLVATQAQTSQEAGATWMTFAVQVVESPEGSALAGVPARYRLAEVETLRTELVTGELDWPDLMQFGRLLTDALFPPGSSVDDLLRRSLVNVRSRDYKTGLRLHLSLDQLLSDVPWECMLLNLRGGKATQSDFLALMPDVSIVRHRSATYPTFPIEANLPARVLVALSSPTSMDPLDLAAECSGIEQALGKRPEVQPQVVPNATRRILEALEPAHVFHFSGHGTFDVRMGAQPGVLEGEGTLIFEDEQHEQDPIPAADVAINLRARGVRVAVLNACQTGQSDSVNVWSSAATSLLTAGLGAVVGMQFRVGDAAATAFSKVLYQALIGGAAVDEAVSMGRQAIAADDDRRGWITPVLYLNTPDGVVFPEFASSRELRDMQVRLPKIEFGPFIEQQTQHFVGRDWLFKAIDDWLGNPSAQRYFLIKAEPGSGKTSIAARLCQLSMGDAAAPVSLAHLTSGFLSAWHFFRVNEGQWTNAQAFTKSLAHQLAERHFGFRQSLLQKMQSLLGGSDFVSLVREPLNDLFSDSSAQPPIVILIDSMHEAAQETVKLISQIQMPAAQVRFIVTSWPQSNVLDGVLETDIRSLSLSDDPWRALSLQDVREYAVDMAGRLGLETRLAPDLSFEEMVDAVRDKSDGNFLYADALIKALNALGEAITAESMTHWPSGLTPLYQVLLPRLLGRSTPGRHAARSSARWPSLGRGCEKRRSPAMLGRSHRRFVRCSAPCCPFWTRTAARSSRNAAMRSTIARSPTSYWTVIWPAISGARSCRSTSASPTTISRDPRSAGALVTSTIVPAILSTVVTTACAIRQPTSTGRSNSARKPSVTSGPGSSSISSPIPTSRTRTWSACARTGMRSKRTWSVRWRLPPMTVSRKMTIPRTRSPWLCAPRWRTLPSRANTSIRVRSSTARATARSRVRNAACCSSTASRYGCRRRCSR